MPASQPGVSAWVEGIAGPPVASGRGKDHAGIIIKGGMTGRLAAGASDARHGALHGYAAYRRGIGPGLRVLDVGCGGGDVTREIARRIGAGGHVTGIDMDEVEIGLAREEATALRLVNVDYRVGNLLTDTIGERFDAIYARFLLSHLSNPELGLARMVACLKPGGLIVLEDVDFSGCFCHPPRAAFADYVRWYEESARRRGADSHLGVRLPSLLAEAGIQVDGARAVIPAAIEGPIKEIAVSTLSAIADAVIEEGLASRAAVKAAIADLAAAVADPGVFLSMPRIVQCWGRAG